MATASDVEKSVLSHFSSQWGTRCAINWSSQNAPFRQNTKRASYTDNKTYVVPRLQLSRADSLEYPFTDSARIFDYQFLLNLVTETKTGMNNIHSHVDRIREILELKQITLSGTEVNFEVVRTRAGFLSGDGDEFEVPVSIFFSMFLTAT
jgi:hypothetical protein